MATIIVTGVGGLVGSAAARRLVADGHAVIGVDNNMRAAFFGADGSVSDALARLQADLGDALTLAPLDVRDRPAMEELVSRAAPTLGAVIHAAAQPSHDWAASDPHTDFSINAGGTLTLLEAVRRTAPEAPFVFCSTNKVYGDRPNTLPFVELETRYELPAGHDYAQGIREDMSIDQSVHSVFGVSKVAADLMVQEYGANFGLPTMCLRAGTITGPGHSAAELHGFIAYLTRCALEGRHYTVFGYKGKQVRDVIHADDLVSAMLAFIDDPRPAAVYNIGGGRSCNVSVLEAIGLVEDITGRRLSWDYSDGNRVGDHLWWIGDNAALRSDYPGWDLTYDITGIIREIAEANVDRWVSD